MRKVMLYAAAAGALFLVVSCASTPPKADSMPPQPPQPETPVAAAPEAELQKAKDLQQRVDALQLGTYAPDDYAAANKDFQAGQEAYGKNNAASKKSLQAAIAEFNTVLSKGGAMYLAGLQRQAEASKRIADEVKASVAVKDDYETADGLYKKALQEKDAGDIENAGRDFSQSRTDFESAALSAQQKRDAALQALQDAQQDRTSSEKKADDAQKALQDEGFGR